jgi:hypothetical protein
MNTATIRQNIRDRLRYLRGIRKLEREHGVSLPCPGIVWNIRSWWASR